jgi:uroporphyrinogen-III decarboxylase
MDLNAFCAGDGVCGNFASVNCPYSVLSSFLDARSLYRAARNNKKALHDSLGVITQGLSEYIVKTLAGGAKIISLADPYAQISVLGRAHCLEFAGRYLVMLLKRLSDSGLHGVVHLCPHSSVMLEALSLITIKGIDHKTTEAAYIDMIRDDVFQNPERPLVFTGHQCIHTKKSNKIIKLSVVDGDYISAASLSVRHHANFTR